MLKHFGCVIRHPESAKLTRENYAPITEYTRKNSMFHRFKELQDLSMEEVNEVWWEAIGADRKIQYLSELEDFYAYFDEMSDETKAQEVLQEYIQGELLNLLEYELTSNPFGENTQQSEQYEALLHGQLDIDIADEAVNERYMKYLDFTRTIQEMTVEQLVYKQAPSVWKRWKKSDKYNGVIIPDEYITEYIMEFAPYYSDKYCLKQQKRALENFDRNMAYYASLDKAEFDAEISSFLENHSDFIEISDLRPYATTGGIYVMVLDEYKQIYVGITRAKIGIKGRIQQHWSNVKPLDRLIWVGGETNSLLSIDSFRSLDSTRIFVSPHPEFSEYELDENGEIVRESSFWGKYNVRKIDTYLRSNEYNLIENAFSQKFLCNRCAGGLESLVDSFLHAKTHDLPAPQEKTESDVS